VSNEVLIGQKEATPGKHRPAPKLQQQIERIQRLPKAKQRFVMEGTRPALCVRRAAAAAVAKAAKVTRRAPTAEEVSNETQANFCDHFKPRPGAFTAPNTAEVYKAKAELERLFGKK
jgi:hypothetical protein